MQLGEVSQLVFATIGSAAAARATVLLWVIHAVPVASSFAVGQQGPPRGRVVSSSGRPLAGAEVRVVEVDKVARTDGDGWFVWSALRNGNWTVTVRAIGFAPRSFRVSATGSDFSPNRFELDEAPQQLDPLAVVARPTVATRLAEFERRRRFGSGRFFTREDIVRAQATRISGLLRALPAGVRVLDSLGTPLPVSKRGPKLVNDNGQFYVVSCVLRTVIDGQVQPWGTSLDIIDPTEVVGIEVYLGASSIPAEFAVGRRDQFCGLLVFWTRSG